LAVYEAIANIHYLYVRRIITLNPRLLERDLTCCPMWFIISSVRARASVLNIEARTYLEQAWALLLLPAYVKNIVYRKMGP
jgi:hypothetical protein